MYLVIEIQTTAGKISTLNYQYDKPNLAEQKYYQILSVATVSSVDVHAVMLVDNRGVVLKNDFYDHTGDEDNE